MRRGVSEKRKKRAVCARARASATRQARPPPRTDMVVVGCSNRELSHVFPGATRGERRLERARGEEREREKEGPNRKGV